jgi:hypothetical protein
MGYSAVTSFGQWFVLLLIWFGGSRPERNSVSAFGGPLWMPSGRQFGHSEPQVGGKALSEASETHDVQAARLMLYVLDAFYPDNSVDFRSRSYRVLPESAPTSFDRGSQLLAALSKPVQCSAQREGPTLSVTCRSEPPARTDAERESRANHVRARLAFVNGVVKRHSDTTEADLIYRLTDGRSGMPVSLSVLRRWSRDYIVADHAMTLARQDSGVVEPDPGFAGTIVLRGDDEMLDSLHFTPRIDKPKR